MRSTRRFTGLLLVLVSCLAAWAYYQVVKPRRAIRQFMAQVSELQVGRTSQAEFHRLTGMNRPAKSWTDCRDNRCAYGLQVRNAKLLETLRIAPAVYFDAVAETNGEVVTRIMLYVELQGVHTSSHLRVEQFSARVTGRPAVSMRTGHVSARTLTLQDGTPVQSLITLDEDASDADRRNAFGIDARCWSRLSGCSNVRELLPNFAKL